MDTIESIRRRLDDIIGDSPATAIVPVYGVNVDGISPSVRGVERIRRAINLLPLPFIRALAAVGARVEVVPGCCIGNHPLAKNDGDRGAMGFAVPRLPDELKRLLYFAMRLPHHAARIKGFTPNRLVWWLQDELKRFNDAKADAAAKEDPPATWESFTLHDFRRTAITAMQMSGASEKETSVMVGATPEVIRRHYEKMDQLGIARRSLERRQAIGGAEQNQLSLRARCAQAELRPVDVTEKHA